MFGHIQHDFMFPIAKSGVKKGGNATKVKVNSWCLSILMLLTPVAGSIFRPLSQTKNLTPVAGLIFETKKSRDFSGENFLERNYCPRTSHVMFSGRNP